MRYLLIKVKKASKVVLNIFDNFKSFDSTLVYPHAFLELPINSVPLFADNLYLIYTVLENNVQKYYRAPAFDCRVDCAACLANGYCLYCETGVG